MRRLRRPARAPLGADPALVRSPGTRPLVPIDPFDRLAMRLGRDMSRGRALKILAGAAAGAAVGVTARPEPARAADPGCSGIRTFYRPDCQKAVTKSGAKPPGFNGCGPENGVNVVPNNPLGTTHFTNPCNGHDICYSTCGSGKDSCDQRFYDDMFAACKADYQGTTSMFDAFKLGTCVGAARAYYQAVSTGGKNAYEAAQKERCDCCEECPGGAVKCAGKCCLKGQYCSPDGHCCADCENGWVKCPYPAQPICKFGCCNPATPVCCPGVTPGSLRCCPNGCFKGGCS